MFMDYNFKEVEKKWKKYWKDNETFKTDVWDFSKPKYYALDMFPYPHRSFAPPVRHQNYKRPFDTLHVF